MKAIESSLAIFSIETADKNKIEIKEKRGESHGTEAAKKVFNKIRTLCAHNFENL